MDSVNELIAATEAKAICVDGVRNSSSAFVVYLDDEDDCWRCGHYNFDDEGVIMVLNAINRIIEER
jgi:hypothetical protein